MLYMVWTTIRGEEDKAVVLQISLERDINTELLRLYSAVVLGAAVGLSGQGVAAPSSSQPTCSQPPRSAGQINVPENPCS